MCSSPPAGAGVSGCLAASWVGAGVVAGAGSVAVVLVVVAVVLVVVAVVLVVAAEDCCSSSFLPQPATASRAITAMLVMLKAIFLLIVSLHKVSSNAVIPPLDV